MVMMRILNCCYFILLSLRHVTHDFSSGGYDASTNFKRIEAPEVGIQIQQRGNELVLLTWSSIKTYQTYRIYPKDTLLNKPFVERVAKCPRTSTIETCREEYRGDQI